MKISRLEFAKTSALAVTGTFGLTLTPLLALATATNRAGSLSISQAQTQVAQFNIDSKGNLNGKRPNPNSTLDQLLYTADVVARFAGYNVTSLPQIVAAVTTGNIPAAIALLIGAAQKDPDVGRLIGILKAYQGLGANAFGYYAVILIANTDSGKSNWKAQPMPWGTPST
ncbi:MAG: hypothetical protein WA510_28270 [Acidobacteriaceae bacterium]